MKIAQASRAVSPCLPLVRRRVAVAGGAARRQFTALLKLMKTSPQTGPAPDAGANPQLELPMVPPAAGTDAPAPPAVPAPEPEKKPRRGPLALNTVQVEELNRTALLCAEAQQPVHAPVLLEQGLDAAFVTALVNDVTLAGRRSTNALQCTNGIRSATGRQDLAQQRLMKTLRQIQSAAVFKHRDTDPARIADYLVGQPIDDSRPLLEQAALAIISKAAAERPAGINPDFIARATSERLAYVASEDTQRDETAAAKSERVARNQLVHSIKQRRIKLQLAADTAWPSDVPENGPVRTRFFLRPNRAYRPRQRRVGPG